MIAIALELKKGPVVYALLKSLFVTVFPVHALSLARDRQTFWPSGAKDAELALELMLRYPQKIKAIEPDNADIRILQQLIEQRGLLAKDKRRFVNRLINKLKQYYPHYLALPVGCCMSNKGYTAIKPYEGMASPRRCLILSKAFLTKN